MIEIRDLFKTYGEGEAAVHALAGTDVLVQQSEFVAVMGPSGSGKSTLMNIIGCLDRPTSGSYWLDGRDVSRLNKNELAEVRSQKIGFIFQSFNLLARLSALENVMLPMLYNLHEKPDAQEQRRRAVAALEAVGLGQRMSHRPNQLSGGQQQRVAIARALVNRPPLILADEPTGNLDSQSSLEIMEILHRLHEQGTTIVLVTHEPDVAVQAQRIICLHDGRVLSHGHEGLSPCLESRERAAAQALEAAE
ncbi:MAG: ABC transporter ATP-binding protein [Anaerolineales bacterium]|nr:ABC transporter ATP-binding protein [Anaerolineales bacterium]